MFGLSLVVRAERGVLKSSVGRLQREIRQAGARILACQTAGMISQNNTPERLVPFLRRFDRQIWWGEYIVIVAERISWTVRQAAQEGAAGAIAVDVD